MIKAVITGTFPGYNPLMYIHRSMIEDFKKKLEFLIKSPIVMEWRLHNDSFSIRDRPIDGVYFQCLITKPKISLKTLLLLIAYIKSLTTKWQSEQFDVLGAFLDAKISLGIGQVSDSGLNEPVGSAFDISLHNLIEMAQNGRSLHVSSDDSNNSGLSIASLLLDDLISKTTPLQCEVLHYKIEGLTEYAIAEKVGRKQSSVNQRLAGAGWNTINAVIKEFESMYS